MKESKLQSNSINKKPMRQKRQHFQKQIRRQTIEKIFKANRKKYFNYSYQNQITTQTSDQIKDECITEFTRYINQIEGALKNQNQNFLCTSVKESCHFLKRILTKAKSSADCLTFIVQNWFNIGFDQRLFDSVDMFTSLSKTQFCGARRETSKYAVQHFHHVFEYETAIKKKDQYHEDMFRFLFLTIVQLGNEPDSIMQIFVLLNSVIYQNTEIRHQFFFNNRQENNQSKSTKICFEHVISAIYQNQERMKIPNSQNQRAKFNQLKMLFIVFFNFFCNELKDMEKYIDNCQKVGMNKNIPQSQKLANQIYEETLRLVGFPDKIVLKSFLETPHIVIIYELIKQMKTLSFDHLSQGAEHEQNLVTCLQGFRGLIEFHSSTKILRDFSNQLQFLISRLCSKEASIIAKNEIMILIDTIIFIDKNNEMTDHLVKNHSLFERVWSYEENSNFNVRLNILNNIILSNAGFEVAMRYLSEIYITLCECKYVHLAQTFCINYFTHTQYSFAPSSRFDLVVDILYKLPKDKFTAEEIQRDYYIFANLYEKGFTKPLPQRYLEWRNSMNLLKIDEGSSANQEKNYEREQEIMLIDRISNLEKDYLSNTFYMEE